MNSNNKPKYYLAIDLGASSGRHIVGYKQNGEIITQEVYRFANGMDEQDGSLVWDVKRLFLEIKTGIKIAIDRFGKIESLQIDTWGVDYVLIDNNDNEIYPCYAYRDGRVEKSIPEVHKIIDFGILYKKTGIQFQTFNTIYQLYADKMAGRLDNAKHFLMLPEYFNYLLTGNIKKEYTIESTGGLVNVNTKQFDKDIIKKLGFNEDLFEEIYTVGTIVGDLLPEIEKEVGGQIKVKLCASHDTASAFEAVDNEANTVVISSGTWSLVGIKSEVPDTSKKSLEDNFTNEGGVGYIRYLKNIIGLWLNNCLQKEYKIEVTEMVKLAEESSYKGVFDVNDASFLAPKSMTKAIKDWFIKNNLEPPKTHGDFINSVYLSLATGYANVVKQLESNLQIDVKKIYIVGGGAKNALLNKYTSQIANKQVVALPIEATSIGNLKVQID